MVKKKKGMRILQQPAILIYVWILTLTQKLNSVAEKQTNVEQILFSKISYLAYIYTPPPPQ